MLRVLAGQEWGKEAERIVDMFFLEKSPSTLNGKTREIKNSGREISRPGGEWKISHLARTIDDAPATDSLLFINLFALILDPPNVATTTARVPRSYMFNQHL